MKRILLFTMLLSVLLSTLTSCNTSEDENSKWLLTYEKKQYSDEFDNNSVIYEGYFEYDTSGKLISEEFIYDSKSSICSNFEYDKKGNLIYKSGTQTDNSNGELPYSYTYSYDSKNNCISTVVDLGPSTENITYEYDEYGNVIEAYSIYKSDLYTRETDYTHKLSYDDGVCIEDEIQEKRTDEFEKEVIYYSLKSYIYDENGNLAEERLYDCIESASDAKSPIKINGRYYKHYSTTYYTYEKFEDVCVSTGEKNHASHGDSTSTSKIESVDVKLSDSCDKIIYSVKDEADYYEFVVNEEIAYPKTSYKVGVIKNNEWLVKMSEQSPLLNNDNTWKSLEDVNSNPLDAIRFEYLGEGCFLYYVDYFTTNINTSGIIYNPSNNVFLSVQNMSYYDNFNNIVENGIIVVMNCDHKWISLDTNTGKTTTINGYFKKDSDWKIVRLQGLSEGLFMARIENFGFTTKYITGFFDLNGDLIVDLSQYGYPDKNNNYRFSNGQCTITTKNDTGVTFNIVIDKSGNIISQEKID